MNDVATFFRDRQKDPGATYQLALEGWKGTHRVSVYSQKPIESRALQDQSVASQQDYDVALKDLRNAITGNGGGGMIVIANDEGRARTFNVLRVNTKPYVAAERFVALSPGRPPAVLTIDGNNRGYKCAAGSYVLVPVNEEAQSHLQDLLGYLSWLSPDLESLVLNAIRRPSLDRRLDRVETRLFSQTADEAMGSAQHGPLARIKSWMTSSVPAPVIRLATAVLLVVLIAMNGAILYRLYSSSDTSDLFARLEKKEKPPVDPSVVSARKLLKALQESNKPLLRSLDDKHFKSLAEPQADEEIYKALQDNPAVLWGLVKLELLAIKPDSQSSDFVTADDEALTNGAYKAIPQNKIATDARQFLAAVGCRMHYEPPLPFAFDDCTKVPKDAFEKGLQRLTKFVEARP